jgi:beta-lactamase class A
MATPSISHYLAGRRGNITAAVFDVESGTTSLWRPGVAEYTASIEKVDILATLLHRYHDERRSLSPADSKLATKMIQRSDNAAADALWDAAGRADGVVAFDRLLGLAGTVPGPDELWGMTKTTASDQVTLMKALVLQNPVLDGNTRNYILALMRHVDASDAWGVSAGAPRGVTVALKNGWLPLDQDDWQVNSIGWVNGGGRNYVLAVLTNENSTEGYGVQTIQGLSRLIWSNSAT